MSTQHIQQCFAAGCRRYGILFENKWGWGPFSVFKSDRKIIGVDNSGEGVQQRRGALMDVHYHLSFASHYIIDAP